MKQLLFSNIKNALKTIGLAVAITAIGASGSGLLQASQVEAEAATQSSLQSTLDGILADPRLEGAQVGVVVRDAETGNALYDRNSKGLLIPASNNKLYSSAAALEVLGPNHSFKTSVTYDGKRVGSMVTGNLYLKGTGDPTMQASDYDALAQAVAAKGVKQVMGNLVADDSYFDKTRLGYNWGWDSNPYYYQPEISALTVAANNDFDISALVVRVAPNAAAGKPAAISTLPATNFVTFRNETTTGPAGSQNTLQVQRELGVNTIVVTGNIPIDATPAHVISTVSDPTGYAASIFRDALNRHGVKILGKTVQATMPAETMSVAERTSMPLSELLTPYLKLSNNGIAEILVKAMGQKTKGQGTWSAGLAAETDALKSKLGVNVSKLQFVDGSGLSNVNFTTPEQTTNLLRAARGKSWFQTWYNALPAAGQPDRLVGGTLRSRMQNTPAAGNVHAKTGSLDNVSALSGYVTTADQQKLVFSVMTNNYIKSSTKPLEDAIAIALASYSQNGTTSNTFSKPNTRMADQKDNGLECSWTPEGC